MNLFKSLAAGYKRFTKGAKGMETPDITRAQEVAFGQAVVALLIVFGFDVGEDVEQLILFLSAAIGIALPASDAVIRQGRAKSASEIEAAQAAAQQRTQQTISVEERRRLILRRNRLAALHRRP